MLVTCGQIAYPDYQPETWHVYLTLLAILVANGLIAMQPTRIIGWVNQVGTVWNVAVLCIFVVWFPAGSIHEPKTNASHSAVWTSFENGTAWPIGWYVAFFSLCRPCQHGFRRLHPGPHGLWCFRGGESDGKRPGTTDFSQRLTLGGEGPP